MWSIPHEDREFELQGSLRRLTLCVLVLIDRNLLCFTVHNDAVHALLFNPGMATYLLTWNTSLFPDPYPCYLRG